MAADHQNDKRKRAEKAAALLALTKTAMPPAGACPAAEELAALVDGRSRGETATKLREHFGSCEQCYNQWLLLTELKKEHSPKGRIVRLKRIKRLSYVGSALAAAASVAVFLNISRYDKEALDTSVPRSMVLEQVKSESASSSQSAMEGPADSKDDSGVGISGSVVPIVKTPAVESETTNQPPGVEEKLKLPIRIAPAPKKSKIMVKKEAPSLAPRPASLSEFKDKVREVEREAKATEEERTVFFPVQQESISPVAPPASLHIAPARQAVDTSGKRVQATLPQLARREGETFTAWFQQVVEACRTGRREKSFWFDIRLQGERILANTSEILETAQNERGTAILDLLHDMDGSDDSVTRQCRVILSEFAGEH